MLLTPDQFSQAFDEIRRTSLTHSTCKLAIFVSSLDVDAICASRMLSDLLKKNLIVFQIIPVVGYNDLKAKYAQLDESISNVMMLGCGSMVDMESFLEIDVNQYMDKEYYDNVVTPENSSQQLEENVKLTRKIYILDGHRPWNLDNLYGSHMIYCFDDGRSTDELVDEKTAYDYLISIGSDAEDDDDGDDDDDDDDDNDDEEKEDRDHVFGIDADEEAEEDEELSEGRKRSQPSQSSQRKRKRNETHAAEQTIEEYYNQGTTVTTASAVQLYSLLSTIGESNIDALWLSIVGAASLNGSFPDVYDETAPLLREEVNRLRQTSHHQHHRQPSAPEGNLDQDLGDKADNHSLESTKEYSLFLLHHWTLYDAFFYSNYVNSKLQLYTSEGRKKLKTMFARMGISLAVAAKNWHYVDTSLKRRIDGIFAKNLSQMGLTDVVHDGFIRHYGFQGSMSAGDFVEAVTALLEYDGDFGKIKKDSSSTTTTAAAATSSAAAPSNATTPPADDEEEADESQSGPGKLIARREAQFVTNFWKAYDALNNFEMVNKGISIAQLQQRFIFEKGFEIFHKRLVRNLQIFRLVVLKDSFVSNNTLIDPSRTSSKKDTVDFQTLGSSQRLFQNPLILTKLGNWILEACAEMGDKKPLPLVIASLDKDAGTYLVCGLPPKYPNMKGLEDAPQGVKQSQSQTRPPQQPPQPNDKTTVLNTFSLAFQEIANITGAKARIDSFESSIIEIRKEDLSMFLERLTMSGLV